MPTLSEIQAYYDQSHHHYVHHWQLNRYQAMHYGLWWPETRRFGEALLNTQRYLTQLGEIQAEDRVLDAGCGVGGSAIWLGRQIGCEVLGITLSDKQVKWAQRWAEEQGVADRVSFARQDYGSTDQPSNSFDVVWAVESACHAAYKEGFLQEMYRLLRPGGRFLLCDFMRSETQAATEKSEAYHHWLAAWAIPHLVTSSEWLNMAQRVGFQDLHAQELTQAVEPSARRLYRRYLLGFPLQKAYEWLGAASEVQRKSARSAKWQWQALRQGQWRYAVIKGRS